MKENDCLDGTYFKSSLDWEMSLRLGSWISNRSHSDWRLLISISMVAISLLVLFRRE